MDSRFVVTCRRCVCVCVFECVSRVECIGPNKLVVSENIMELILERERGGDSFPCN